MNTIFVQNMYSSGYCRNEMHHKNPRFGYMNSLIDKKTNPSIM
jgi:hypothetical protein